MEKITFFDLITIKACLPNNALYNSSVLTGSFLSGSAPFGIANVPSGSLWNLIVYHLDNWLFKSE